jgi:hypothetical protein
VLLQRRAQVLKKRCGDGDWDPGVHGFAPLRLV